MNEKGKRTPKEYAKVMGLACNEVITYIEGVRKETGNAPSKKEIRSTAEQACMKYEVTYEQMNRIMHF